MCLESLARSRRKRLVMRALSKLTTRLELYLVLTGVRARSAAARTGFAPRTAGCCPLCHGFPESPVSYQAHNIRDGLHFTYVLVSESELEGDAESFLNDIW